MSTNYTAAAYYGYSLPRSELTISKPNPLWGKVKFDPDTGEKVERSIEEDIELALEEGDNLRHMTRFTRFDNEDFVVLGVQLTEVDLSYGSLDPEPITLLSDAECVKVALEARKLLEKAGIAFDEGRMGHWMVGMVG